jgi:hypothetical protein
VTLVILKISAFADGTGMVRSGHVARNPLLEAIEFQLLTTLSNNGEL